MKVAIIVDFLIEENGGAQKVVEQFLEMYPQADIYTTTFAGEKFLQQKIKKEKFLQAYLTLYSKPCLFW
jgi:hypothetical protein